MYSMNLFFKVFLVSVFWAYSPLSASEEVPLLSRGLPSAPIHARGHDAVHDSETKEGASSISNIGGISNIGDGAVVRIGHEYTQIDQIETAVRMDVSGHARVALGDYFDTSTHVYQTLEHSPSKKLFEQMTPDVLKRFAITPDLILEFEVAAESFNETIGAGLTSSMYPKSLNTYERLSERGHPVASERYADHLLLAVQVERDRDVFIAGNTYCAALQYFMGMRRVKATCGQVRKAYKGAFDAYIPGSEHSVSLANKFKDVEDVETTAVNWYKRMLAVTLGPVACCGLCVIIAVPVALGSMNG